MPFCIHHNHLFSRIMECKNCLIILTGNRNSYVKTTFPKWMRDFKKGLLFEEYGTHKTIIINKGYNIYWHMENKIPRSQSILSIAHSVVNGLRPHTHFRRDI